MVITNVNQVVYQGDGVTTAFPFTFRIIDSTDIKLLLLDSDGTETDILSDYFVDTVNNTVHYPGYAPGAEPALSARPPVLAEGQKLVIYRKLPITQEKDLGDKWPFAVIELGLDKLTMILQDIWDWCGRCLQVSRGQAAAAGDAFDSTVPMESGKVVTGNAAGTGFEAREALMEVNGAWDGEGRQIHSVADPTSPQDALTKNFYDNGLDNMLHIAGVVTDSGELQHIVDQLDAIDERAEDAEDSAEAAATSEDNAMSYKNAAATSAANAANSDASATAAAAALAEYLETKETLTAPAVDSTLTIRGAAADAKVTGYVKNEAEEVTDLLGTTNLFLKAGIQAGNLKTDGTVEVSTSFVVTLDYIPVTAGETLELIHKGGTNYSPKICTYNANKELVLYRQPTVTATTTTTIAEGVSYIKVCVSNAVYNNGYSIIRYASNWGLISGDLKADDLLFKAGIQTGNLKTDGTVENSTSFVVSADYIPVTVGETLELIHAGGLSYTPKICTYNANKELIQYKANTLNAKSTFTITYGVSYIKVCVSNAVYNNGFTIKHLTDFVDEICTSAIGYELLNKGDFTFGAINDNTGAVTVSNIGSNLITFGLQYAEKDIFFRTSGNPVQAQDGSVGIYFYVFYYNSNGTFLYKTQALSFVCIKAGSYYRLVIRSIPAYDFIDKSAINEVFVTPAIDNSVEFSYVGLPLNLKRKGYRTYTLFTGSYNFDGQNYYNQAFAIYNNIIVQGYSGVTGIEDVNKIRLFDIATGELISTIDCITGHANNLSFSNDFYEEGDEFPLLYASNSNYGDPISQRGNKSEVFVARISRTGSQNIRTLLFDDPTVSGYYGTAVYNRETGQLIVTGQFQRTTEVADNNYTIITTWDLNNLTADGDYYRPQLVDRFTVPFIFVPQGQKVLNGCLYTLSSATVGNTRIVVIDLAAKQIVSEITDFRPEIKNHEIEGIDFLPTYNQYEMVIKKQRGPYYLLSFPQ